MRPDGGASLPVLDLKGRLVAEVGLGNRKDIRNAVEAARASTWPGLSAHGRAQVLYYLAENLATREDELAHRMRCFVRKDSAAAREVALSIERLFTYAAYADKWEGRVHSTPYRMITLAMREPVGVLGVVCPDEAPLLGAQRELREETGLTARSWRELARIDLSNSVTDERAILFVADDLQPGEADPDPTEALEVRWVPFDEALAMTLDGRITDCLSVIAIQRIALERVPR